MSGKCNLLRPKFKVQGPKNEECPAICDPFLGPGMAAGLSSIPTADQSFSDVRLVSQRRQWRTHSQHTGNPHISWGRRRRRATFPSPARSPAAPPEPPVRKDRCGRAASPVAGGLSFWAGIAMVRLPYAMSVVRKAGMLLIRGLPSRPRCGFIDERSDAVRAPGLCR